MRLGRRQLLIGGVTALVSGLSTSSPANAGHLQAWGMQTPPPGQLPSTYPLEHTAVSGVATGKHWGCFGRTALDDGNEKRIIAEADGDELWAAEIAGTDGSAGIEINVTGACQQCANRILLPANIDVDEAHGNEIAMPLFGKYGFGIPALITRVKDSAFEVNKHHPGRITDHQVELAVERVKINNTEEWNIVERYVEEMFKPRLGDAWPSCETDLSHVYQSLFNHREVLYSLYSSGRISKAEFRKRLDVAFSSSIQLVIDILTPIKVTKLVFTPAQDITATFFANQ